ncbi:MAG: pyridoxal-dependent decarboxylase [Planctomycetota bacterium]
MTPDRTSNRPHEPLGGPLAMDPDAFRRQAHDAIERIIDYAQRVGDLPVRPPTRPGQVRAAVPETAPESEGGEAEWDAIGRDLDELVLPNTMHWQSPGFFGYFPCNTSGPAIIGELLCAGLGGQGMLWQTAPAANEIERALLDQMARAFGLPDRFLSAGELGGGCIQPTASDSTLVALVAARRRVLERTGADPATLTVYASNQAHSSVLKAAMIAGLARDADDHARVRLIATDARLRLDPDALRDAVERDLEAGLTPCMVCGTIGTTGTTAVDPIDRIAGVMHKTAIAERGAWLHVDAAHAGVLLLCDEYRWMAAGLEHADSLCVNPHKWLLTAFDCDLFWTADRRSLVGSLSVTPEYLRNEATESGEVFDYRDWGVPLGRRFRALKLWLVLRHYGLARLRGYLLEHVRLAERFESWVLADDRFELLAPRTMNLVCFALRSGDEGSRRLMDAVNETGRVFLTHTAVPTADGDRFAIRLAVGAAATGEQHVRLAWDLLAEHASRR